MQGLQVLLCGGKVQPSLVRFAVLLVEQNCAFSEINSSRSDFSCFRLGRFLMLWAFYAAVWLLALGGIGLLCADMKRFKSAAIVMCVFMGALLVARVETLAAFLGTDGAALLVAGGAAYLLGLLFYGLGSRHEWMHGVFHLLCLAGSLLH